MIDSETYAIVIRYIRKYNQYCKWYDAERERIESGSCPFNTETVQHGVTDIIGAAIEALERLEDAHKTRVIRAIDNAKYYLCADIDDDAEAKRTRKAVWISCLDNNNYGYAHTGEYLKCSKTEFDRHKRDFVQRIADNLGL